MSAWSAGRRSVWRAAIIGNNPINVIPQGLFGGMNSFTILAIPFFVSAGELMNYGGITGSAVADTSSVGGMLIPPSIVMVVYGATVSTSIGAMFLGGIIPGILVGLALMTVVALMAGKQDFPRRTERFSRKEAVEIILAAIFPLGMPLLILGGILSGIFTPSEAGAVCEHLSG